MFFLVNVVMRPTREVLAKFLPFDLDMQENINLNIILYFCSFLQTMHRNIAIFIKFF
jgi:hypothetical protein